ncbi:hypothetical protein [Simiduia agarivorans]|uniref:Uncharacterized protein n=1 Tax=Simiduia agarivorans (strain DSM 21679 / JCM 13881 / BCRC 17597 / SA1) TaxID=1117647 RepID=K4KMD0_SIMAS|nr:hypothetical protein [Simiduia agarivorans]AFU99390.2 hypothetical protein M5M_11065 [Simiduia agarivorans SA1 = DSM 21679]
MSQPHVALTGSENKEVQFASRQESVFPHLMRLCMDFSLRVIDDKAQFHLRASQGNPITPAFDSLEALERHVHANMVDILHGYLFQTEDAVAH